MKPKSTLRHFLALAGSLMLAISSAHAVDGTWNVDAAGTWSTSGNWAGSPDPVPGGAGSIIGLTNNISANRTVTINTTSRTVGQLTIGDSDNTHAFTLAASGGAGLILNNSGSAATITENGSIADTISAPVTLADNLNVTTSGTLTMSGVISETGGAKSITKNGTGILVLSGNNTYSGGFTLNEGQVNALPTAAADASVTYNGFGTGLLTINGGSIRGAGSGGRTGATIIGNDVQWNGNVGFGRSGGGLPNFTFNGDVALGASVSAYTQSGAEPFSLTFNGNISEDAAGYGLNLSSSTGASVWTFNGQNTFTGDLVTNTKATVIGGSGYLGGGNYAGKITMGTGGTLTYSSSANQTISGVISGASLTKNNNDSTLTLTGANTYTGGTTVNEGTLLINGSTSSTSLVTVNNGGTLGGTGTIGGSVTLNSGSTLSPGASIESLATGSNVWNGGSTIVFEFSTDGSSGTAGTQWGLLAITGTLGFGDASDTNRINFDLVTMLNATTAGLLGTWDPDADATWAGFVTTTGGITNFAANLFNIDTTGFQNTINGSFSIVQDGNNLNLVYTAIPEPRAALLGGLGLLALLRRRRA